MSYVFIRISLIEMKVLFYMTGKLYCSVILTSNSVIGNLIILDHGLKQFDRLHLNRYEADRLEWLFYNH